MRCAVGRGFYSLAAQCLQLAVINNEVLVHRYISDFLPKGFWLSSAYGLSVLPLFSVLVLLPGCGVDANYGKFTQALGSPHDLQVVRLASKYYDEPLLPLPLALDIQLQDAKVALGDSLFHDKRLSSDDSISCASCHNIAAGGSDNRNVALGVGGAEGGINTPTVLNATFNFAQYWDGRVRTLAEQVRGPVHNEKEMASSWPLVVAKLSKDSVLLAQFSLVYPEGFSGASITDAIVEYERSLTTPSTFDRFLRGDDDAISPLAKQGYALFKDYGCASCHQGTNVGGNMFQKFGAVLAISGAGLPDTMTDGVSRAALTGPKGSGLFKVPSLRNAARTAPYFHNASAVNLAQAIDTMGQIQLGRKIQPEENKKIQAFIESLSAEGID